MCLLQFWMTLQSTGMTSERVSEIRNPPVGFRKHSNVKQCGFNEVGACPGFEQNCCSGPEASDALLLISGKSGVIDKVVMICSNASVH